MKVLIEISGMEFYAYHGCYEREKSVGSPFVVDVAVEADIKDAAERDSLKDTVNYLTVYGIVTEQMRIVSDTIENVALRIVDAIYLLFPDALKVTAKVSKLAPPLGGKADKVSATITKQGQA